jgi:hypothetical protein
MKKAPSIATPIGQGTMQQCSKPNQRPPRKGGGHLGQLVGRPAQGAAAPYHRHMPWSFSGGGMEACNIGSPSASRQK